MLCLWVEPIWFCGVLNYKVDRCQISSWVAWFHSILSRRFSSKKEHAILLSHVAFTCWHIWKARCQFMFNHSSINHSQVRHAISLSAAVYLGVMGVPPSSRLARASVAVPTARWSSPLCPFLKVIWMLVGLF